MTPPDTPEPEEAEEDTALLERLRKGEHTGENQKIEKNMLFLRKILFPLNNLIFSHTRLRQKFGWGYRDTC